MVVDKDPENMLLYQFRANVNMKQMPLHIFSSFKE